MRDIESKANTVQIEKKERQKDFELYKANSLKLKEEIANYSVKVKELKDILAWEEEALFSWEEELAKEDRTRSMLTELTLQDEEKFNDLDMRRQMLEFDYGQQKMTEERDINILQNMETQLGQFGKLFREVTHEQNKLLHQWHDMNNTLKGRSHLVKNCYAVVDKIRTMAREKYFELHEKRKLLLTLQKDNAKHEVDIEKFKASLLKGKNVTELLDKTIAELTGKTNTLQRYILDSSSKVNLQKAQNTELQNSVKALEQKINNLVHSNLELQIKLDTLNVDSLTIEQQTKNTEDIYEMGEKVLIEESKEFDRLQILIYKLRQDLSGLKNKLLVQNQQLNCIRQEKREVEKQIKTLQNEYNEYEDNLFSKELALEVLSEKYTQLVGEALCDELDDKLRDEGIKIEKDISDFKNEIGNYKFQIRILKKDLVELTAIINEGKKELDTLVEQGTNLKLVLTCGKKVVNDVTEEYNGKLIDLNVVKMQASLAKENNQKLQNELCMLEKQRIILDTGMQERNCEIKSQKDEMLMKKKGLLDERSVLKKNIEQVNLRIKQIQKRFEITMDLLGKDDCGERQSVSYFKIKLAQEKHQLQEMGDDLEAKINKTEKEIQAMENTLRVVSLTNENYKTNLETVDLDGPEMQEYYNLEAKCHEVNQQCKANTSDMNNIKVEIKKLQSGIQMYQNCIMEMQEEWKTREGQVEVLTKDLAKKQLKLARASKIMKRLMTEVKATKEPISLKKMALRDIELRLEQERNKSVLQQLAEFVKNYYDAAPIAERLLSDRSIILPEITVDKISDRAETRSKASDVSEISICSISPSIMVLDPTILLPEEFRPEYKERKVPKINFDCK
ncbi:coiled-coil domain-containing protein 39 isoform X2 [Cimex lectularius]|nr:coiled-coil domain-containing protein 39 isoform X2 [Cimex lectularius]